MSGDTNIQLLAQRLEATELLNAEQQKELRELRSKIDKNAGAQEARDKGGDWVKKLLPVIFSVVVIGGVGFIWNTSVDGDSNLDKKMSSLAETQVEMRVIDGSRDKEVERINARLAKLENKKSDDLGPLTARLVSAEANILRIDGAVVEHEDEIDDLEDEVNAQQKSISSIKASATASFTEVETQIRATWDVINTMEGYNRQLDGLIWKKIFGETLPDNEYFSTNIPAQATTQIGKVNGD